jgi:bla regulator protein BlaR1
MNAIFEQINLTGKAFVEFAWPMLVQSSLLILILLLADLLLRRKVRAVFRYWVWLLILVKLVLPTSLSSPVSLGYLLRDELELVKLGRTDTVAEPAVVLPPSDMQQPVEPESIAPTVRPLSVSRREPAAVESVAEPAVGQPVPVTPLSWQGAVFLAWLAVVAAMGLLLLQRAIFVQGLVAQPNSTDALMSDMLEQCRRRIGVNRKVGLKVSPNATSPAVCGLFRPVILVPQNMAKELD